MDFLRLFEALVAFLKLLRRSYKALMKLLMLPEPEVRLLEACFGSTYFHDVKMSVPMSEGTSKCNGQRVESGFYTRTSFSRARSKKTQVRLVRARTKFWTTNYRLQISNVFLKKYDLPRKFY